MPTSSCHGSWYSDSWKRLKGERGGFHLDPAFSLTRPRISSLLRKYSLLCCSLLLPRFDNGSVVHGNIPINVNNNNILISSSSNTNITTILTCFGPLRTLPYNFVSKNLKQSEVRLPFSSLLNYVTYSLLRSNSTGSLYKSLGCVTMYTDSLLEMLPHTHMHLTNIHSTIQQFHLSA